MRVAGRERGVEGTQPVNVCTAKATKNDAWETVLVPVPVLPAGSVVVEVIAVMAVVGVGAVVAAVNRAVAVADSLPLSPPLNFLPLSVPLE